MSQERNETDRNETDRNEKGRSGPTTEVSAPPGHAPHHAAHETGAEADRPPIRTLWVVLVALTVVIVGSVIGIAELFKVVGDRRLQEANLSVENRALAELRARDREAATTWGVVDAEAGRYRMPVAVAMERLLADPTLIGPLAEPPAPGADGSGAEGSGDGGGADGGAAEESN